MPTRTAHAVWFRAWPLLLLAIGLLGCLPPPVWQEPARDTSRRRAEAQSFQPEPGRGVLYVFPELDPRVQGRMKVLLDDRECGYTTATTFLRLVLPPGDHDLSAVATFRGFWGRVDRAAPPRRIRLEAGSVHYLGQTFAPASFVRFPWAGDAPLQWEEGPAEAAQPILAKLALAPSTSPLDPQERRDPVPAQPPVPSAVKNAQGFWEAEAACGSCRLRLVQLPSACIPMGCPELLVHGDWYNGSDAFTNDSERPVHAVTLSAPFWIGTFDVTQGQFLAVLGYNPSHFRASGPDAPVENLEFERCLDFIARLNALQPDWTFRLPTEAEWEFACRGGAYGPSRVRVETFAWCGGGTTHPVGLLEPNGYGLYDMLGNVRQWCQDRWARYTADPGRDPGSEGWRDVFKDYQMKGRRSRARLTCRGSSYASRPEEARPTVRGMLGPYACSRTLGFRVVAVPRQGP